MSDVTLLDTLVAAIARSNAKRVELICDDLVSQLYRTDEPLSERDADRILQVLRRARLLGPAQRLADALVVCGLDTPRIRRAHARILLDVGQISPVRAYLGELAEKSGVDRVELRDVQGLKGRAFKQLYILLDPSTQRAKRVLAQAIELYSASAAEDPVNGQWFTINVVALLCRAARDGISLTGIVPEWADAAALSRGVLEQIETENRNGTAEFWDFATAVEACIALQRYDEALFWLLRYVTSKHADVFEFDSMHRQLVGIWGLDGMLEPGTSLLSVLNGARLQRAGVALALGPQELAPGRLLKSLQSEIEREIPEAATIQARLSAVSDTSASVVRIASRTDGRIRGNGILLLAADLNEQFGQTICLLTSSRVLSDQPAMFDAVRSDDAVMTGSGAALWSEHHSPVAVEKILWSSPPHELGMTVASLRDPADCFRPLAVAPMDAQLSLPDHVFAAGQGHGDAISLSIQQNRLFHRMDGRIHCRSLYDPLLAGAALFDGDWNLLGVQVGQVSSCAECEGDTTEGVLLSAVRQGLQSDFRDVGEVFVCYSRQNRAFVTRLAEALSALKIRVWLDSWSIPDGANWDAEVDDALNRCSRMLIILSPEAVQSNEVRSELRFALDEKKPIIPLLHKTCPIPRQLRRTQYIDFSGSETLDETLVRRVLEALRAGSAINGGE